MKIGLISDTHGFLDEKVFSYFQHCDQIWHAGDLGTLEVAQQLASYKSFKAVFGNIDGSEIRQQYPKDLWFECEGKIIWMTHIGGYPPRYTPEVLRELKEKKPDIFICGHSHILKIISDPNLNNLLHLNPGAAGRQGFHEIRTLIRFDISHKVISQVQVVELGKRG